ncbi:MAG: NAD-binding protein [Clostridia bacterium]|nr:NAD-binding protein [Clostridia bacterium]
MKLLFVGGDKRTLLLAGMLKKDGYEVSTLGLREGDETRKDFSSADVILFPYPFAVKGGCVPALNGMTIHPEDVLEKACAGCLLLAGRGLEPYALAEERMPKCFRLRKYEQDAELLERNADISAEAAVFETMQRSDRTIAGMRILVTGYGLFGCALAHRLKAFGAQVWVAARRGEVRRQAQDDGMHAISLQQIRQIAGQMDMLLNTVPARIIDEDTLQAFRQGTWLLELASAPYGFDRDAAAALGCRCDVLPALPARYAPVSAADALRGTVSRWLKEAE